MNAPTANYSAVREALKSLRGKFFSVTFIKASDGSERKMVCRLGVKSGLSGASTPEEREARRESDEQNGIVRVWVKGCKGEKDGYRSFRIDSIKELKMFGHTFCFTPVKHVASIEYGATTALVKLIDTVWTCERLKNGKVRIPADAKRALGERAAQVEAWLLAR